MTICELTINRSYTQAWYNYQAFVFQSNPAYFQGPGFWNTWFGVADDDSTERIVIGTFRRSPNIVYQKQSSIASCVSTEQSFYWDSTNQVLYVHMEHDIDPYTASFLYGVAQGYSDSDVVYIDDIEYKALIQNSFNIAQQQDIVNYKKPSVLSGTLRLSNKNSILDTFITDNIYGNTIDVYYLPDNQAPYTRSDLVQLQQLVVDDNKWSQSTLEIRYRDVRSQKDRSIPTDVFTTTDYADLDPELNNAIIPLLFGTVRESTAICTNSTTTSGDVNFRQALTLTSLGTVYVKEGDTWTSVTPSSSTVSTGEFVLSAADGRDASGTPLECRVNGSVGIAVTYASDIIKYINANYLSIPYTSTYYDTTEWEAEEVSLSPISYVIDEQKKISEIIVDIQNGSNTGFRYELTNDGKRTIRIDNESRTIAADISNIELQDVNVLSVDTDSDLLAAEIRVKYDKSWNSGRFYSVFDDTSADTVEETYQQRPYKEYETYLISSSAANSKVTYIKNRFSTIRGLFEGTIMGSEHLSRRIYDLINVEITPGMVDRDTDSIVGRQYFGLKLVKILSVDPDIKSKTNRITGVIIGAASYYNQMIYNDIDVALYNTDDRRVVGR